MINGVNGYAQNVTINKPVVAPPAEKTNSVTKTQQQPSLPQKFNIPANGPRLLRGEEAKRHAALGTLGLGWGTPEAQERKLQEWKNSGLEISQETIDAAFRTFQAAHTEGDKLNEGKGWSLSLNGHQIAIDNQDVPVWFLDDYQETLNAMGAGYAKDAFIAGELYAIGPPGLSVKV